MIYNNLDVKTYCSVLNDHSAQLKGVTDRYNRAFHPIDYGKDNQGIPRHRIANTIRSVALFVFTLGIYHAHAQRTASKEWKKVLCEIATEATNHGPGHVNEDASDLAKLKATIKLQKEELDEATDVLNRMAGELNVLGQQMKEINEPAVSLGEESSSPKVSSENSSETES